MGLFGDNDDNNQPSQSEQLLNQQIQENRAELERKKQDLYKTRLDIIKAQGSQQWTPEEPHAIGGGAHGGAPRISGGGKGRAILNFGKFPGTTI